MENFVVSARKYRPDTFDSVVGQSAITNTLRNAIKNGHVGQSFLFCGPRGVGKTTCARIFAKTINCTNPTPDMEACGECESCKAFEENSSFNIYELDAASNRNVEAMRHLIEQVRIPPQVGNFTVYIIDEVHMLTTEAFNTFLKTLEEPPKHAKFILATTEKNKIIPTILSRCQIFDFRRIGISDIVKQLASIAEKEGVKTDNEALRIIAQKADGGMRDALSMFDQIVSFSGNTLTYSQVIEMLNILDYEYYFKICDIFFGEVTSGIAQSAAALSMLNEIWEKGFDPKDFLSGLSHHLRNLLVMQDQNTIALLESSDELRERYAVQARKGNVPNLLRALDLCAQCDLNYRASNHKRLLVEILLLQLCELLSGNTPAMPAQQNNAPQNIPPQNTVQQPQTELVTTTPKSTAQATQAQQQQQPTQPQVQAPPKQPASPANAPQQAPAPAQSTQQAPPKSNFLSLEQLQQKQTAENISAGNNTKSQEFTQTDLNREWKNIVSEIKATSPAFYSVLAPASVAIKDGNQIEIIAENDIHQKEITNKIKDLVVNIRQKLQNDLIEVTVSAAEQTSREKMPYTAKEKFEAMNKINPNLSNFKNELGLEVEL